MSPAPLPNAAAKNPRMAVVHRPTKGETPATKEKATASGIMASETANPETVADHKDFLRSEKSGGKKAFALAIMDSVRETFFRESLELLDAFLADTTRHIGLWSLCDLCWKRTVFNSGARRMETLKINAKPCRQERKIMREG
jgi:hypothetical protein